MNLWCGYSTERKVGKIIFCKESYLAGLCAAVGLATDDFAVKEHFVDRMRMPRHVTMPTIVPHRCELGDPHLEAGFFLGFPLDAFGCRLIHVRPASWQSPSSIADFANKHDTSVTEHDAPDVYFRGGIADFLGKELEDLFDLGA